MWWPLMDYYETEFFVARDDLFCENSKTWQLRTCVVNKLRHPLT